MPFKLGQTPGASDIHPIARCGTAPFRDAAAGKRDAPYGAHAEAILTHISGSIGDWWNCAPAASPRGIVLVAWGALIVTTKGEPQLAPFEPSVFADDTPPVETVQPSAESDETPARAVRD